MAAVLKIDGLVKYFGKRLIINNLSVEVNEGEVFGFLGPNGSGKTTTIKMILGLLNTDGGTISINGNDRVREFEKSLSEIGGIVENPDTYGFLNAYKNLEIYQRARTAPDKERIKEVLSLVGLSNRAKDKVRRYSLGMKQRLGLAQALVHRPKILILDEPTNGLDPAGIRELRDILKKLAHEENIAVFISSHLLSEMQLMCDRVCIIDRGTILSVKTVDELTHDEAGETYRLKLSPPAEAEEFLRGYISEKLISHDEGAFDLAITPDEIPDVIEALVMNKIRVYSAHSVQKSLEDSFIEITKGGNEIA